MTDRTPETLLDELLQPNTASEQNACLDRVCQNDNGLRRRLEGLQEEHRQAEQFFQDAGIATVADQEEGGVNPTDAAPQVEQGSVIGRYKILEKIGGRRT